MRVLGLVCLSLIETFPFRVLPENQFTLEIEKTGLYRGKKHVFAVERYEGQVEYDRQNPAASKVELKIPVERLVLKDEWLGASDFKKVQQYAWEEMLDLRKHPYIEFRSERIEGGGGKFVVTGPLTIRGVAKPVRIEMSLQEDRQMLVAEGRAVVKITDYGLKPPSAALGAIGTKDEMTVRFRLRLHPVAR